MPAVLEYECSACRPQQGEKITLGITSASHVRRDYGCSSGYWRIFPRFQSYFWGRSKWTSFKPATNPHQISRVKKDPMLEELLARVLVCFFDQFYLFFRMGRQTPLHPHHRPRPAALKMWKMVCGMWGRGVGGREGGLVLWTRDLLFFLKLPNCAAQSKITRAL